MLSPDDISELRRLMELREAKDEAEQAFKDAKEAYQEAELDLFDKLTDEAQGAIRRLPNVDLGPPWGKVSFQARETHYARIIPGKENEALEHYEQRAMIDSVTAPKFVMKRLNEEVRDCIEQGKNPPPGIDYYTNRGITVTRQKS